MVQIEMEQSLLTEIATACGIGQSQIEDVYTCTPLQAGMMAETVLYPRASILQFIFTIKDHVDMDRFSHALSQVVSLNAILRTRLVHCQQGLVQVVTNEQHQMEFASCGLEDYMAQDESRRLGPGTRLFRSAIVDSRKLVMTMHHAIVDGASTALLFGDVLRIYRGQEPEKHSPFKDFVSHCANIDQKAAASFWKPRFSGAPAIFPKVLSGHIPLTTVKVNRQITLPDTSGERNSHQSEISISLMPAYVEAAWALTASLYADSESIAYGLLLSGRSAYLSGLESTLGPTLAIVPVQVNLKRNSTTVEGILRERTTALRQLQTTPALQYGLPRIRTLSDAANLASGFQTLINIRISSLFRQADEDDTDSADADRLYTYDRTEEPMGTYGLCLWFDLTPDGGLSLEAMVDPALVCEAQLDRILGQFEFTLRSLMMTMMRNTSSSSATADPGRMIKLDQLPLLNPRDLDEILRWNNGGGKSTETSGQEKRGQKMSIHHAFSTLAQKHADRTAVEASDGRMTYGELDDASSRLSDHLRGGNNIGISKGDSVVFMFEKSIWAIVAELAILKAGGVCVPVESTDPISRKAEIINRAEARVLLTSSGNYADAAELADQVITVDDDLVSTLGDASDDHHENDADGHDSSPEDLAYILFTSGSTGTPKGVMLDHGCIVSAFNAVSDRLGWGDETRMLHFASKVWDMSVAETFGALLSGGCLCIPSEEDRRSGLSDFIQSRNVNWAILTPTVTRTLSPESVPGLRGLASIGEPVGTEAALTWGGQESLRFFNTWGPTEAHNIITAAELNPDSTYPETIGNPVGCRVWIVSPTNVNKLVPIGTVGELVIEGPAVARGYHNDPVRTSSVFISPPTWAAVKKEGESTPRFYRTGDLAKYNPDGSILFIGRQDNQVKIRGQRFELGEVERVMASHPKVNEAFATTKIIRGRTELVAVLCLALPELDSDDCVKEQETGQQLRKRNDLEEIPGVQNETAIDCVRLVRNAAKSKLPSFMIPTVWHVVSQMPHTASAKLDRTSIAAWLRTPVSTNAIVTLDKNLDTKIPCRPETDEEKLLLSVWALVLNTAEEKISCKDSSFQQSGGDSVLAMRVSSECRKRGMAVSTAAILTSSSLSQAAKSMVLIGENYQKNVPGWGSKKPQETTSDGEVIRPVNGLDKPGNGYSYDNEDIEAMVPATDVQAMMMAGKGYDFEYLLDFQPGIIETSRLQSAIKKVVSHHAILRTRFVQRGSELLQVVMKDGRSGTTRQTFEHSSAAVIVVESGSELATFSIFSRKGYCNQLRLKIHHALYDAISLGLIIRDLDAACTGQELSDGPEFHSWVSYASCLDNSQAHDFWKLYLKDSAMSHLVPQSSLPPEIPALDEQIRMRFPLRNLQQHPYGTPSNTLQAIWALVLHCALGSSDVIFGQVSSNRYLPYPGIDQVRGPCVNIVPVRIAGLGGEEEEEGNTSTSTPTTTTTLGELISNIQTQNAESMEFHHMGHASISKTCTSWPRDTRYGSILVYQNHHSEESFSSHDNDNTVYIGGAECRASAHEVFGNSTDIWVVAIPRGGGGGPVPGSEEEEEGGGEAAAAAALEVVLGFTSRTMSFPRIYWISRALGLLLSDELGGRYLGMPVADVVREVRGTVGIYPSL